MVKNFMRSGNISGKKDLYGRVQSWHNVITTKPIIPQEEEIKGNTRSRSAKLRIAESKTDIIVMAENKGTQERQKLQKKGNSA